MLTQVKAYSSWPSAPMLTLIGDRAETDLIQVRNIDGLDPVKASINTTPYGSIDGTSYVGSSVLSRNIVLTLHPNPDWNTYTYSSLRKILYSYFMPKNLTRLIFYSDDMDPVEIYGRVEDVQENMFSKDPEIIVSIVCPNPYFTSLNSVDIVGAAVHSHEDDGLIINYKGQLESGIYIKVNTVSGTANEISIEIKNSSIPTILKPKLFKIPTTLDASSYFELSSVPNNKFVQNVDIDTGVIINLLSKMVIPEKGQWPVLQPGDNEITIYTDSGEQEWEVIYYERFGGL